jgi:adenylosuccinate lyase
LLLALVESGLERVEAYALVQRNAMRAWEEERDFPTLVGADADVVDRLGVATLDDVFSLEPYTRHVEAVFDRLDALVRKEEPVHA